MRSHELDSENETMASSMLDLANSFVPSWKHATSSSSFDLASYSRILQHVAKFYPEQSALALTLNSQSLSLLGAYEPHPSQDAGTLPFPETEKALDLSTQNAKSYCKRITLDQVKPKVVEDVWVENDKKLVWKDSKIAAFNPAQKLFMCLDCEHIGFLSRVAEHWLGSHANLRVFHCPRCPYTSAWSRCVKMHLTRHHNEQSADTTMWKGNPLLIEVTNLMQELRTKVETRIDANNLIADKRFYCPHCPYATDRRDLYTRHENIHKDDKPFHCYVCFKQFNRADHVKKHFVRMHADVEYEISKIRKSAKSNASKDNISEKSVDTSQKTIPTKNDSPLLLSNAQNEGEAQTKKKKGEKAFTCHYCNWSGSDNWCLKRHMNTHIKPFACVLCDYKAARAERLSTHVLKVHNKKICNKCSFLADSQEGLQEHMRDEHHNNPYSRRHICSSCGMSFDTKANLETHTHLSHPRPASPIDVVEITPIFTKEPLSPVVEHTPYPIERYPFPKDASQYQIQDELSQNCPHCDYKLVRNEESREHWMVHHEDVCITCIQVFTSAYGPQMWKKVNSRSDTIDGIVTDLSLKRSYDKSEVASTPVLRPSKRQRKQSFPKRVISMPLLKEESKEVKNIKKRIVYRCRKCDHRPKFYSIAQFKIHRIKRHSSQTQSNSSLKVKQLSSLQ